MSRVTKHELGLMIQVAYSKGLRDGLQAAETLSHKREISTLHLELLDLVKVTQQEVDEGFAELFAYRDSRSAK